MNVLDHALGNWKSTVSSLLTVLIGIGVYLTSVPNQTISAHTAAILTTVVGVAKVVLGFIQNDAKPSVTSSVTIESTSPVAVPPVVVTAPTNPSQETGK